MITFDNLNECDQKLYAIAYSMKDEKQLHWVMCNHSFDRLGTIHQIRVFVNIEDAAAVMKYIKLSNMKNIGTFFNPIYESVYDDIRVVSFETANIKVV